MKNIFHYLQALLAAFITGFPSRKLSVIGVTGTDGKTTTASLIHYLIKKSHKKVGLITTVEVAIDNEQFPSDLHVTTPGPYKLQNLLRQMVDAGCEYAVLEVTSHALDQHRTAFIDFDVGVLTNVTEEHLDYHKTYENYLKTKLKLLKRADISVVNADLNCSCNPCGCRDGLWAGINPATTYGLNNTARFIAEDIEQTDSGMQFTVNDKLVKTKLLGEYNLYNILAALSAVTQLGFDLEKVVDYVKSFDPPQGRFELVKNNRGLNIVIDFAHTPNALENVLQLVADNIKKGNSQGRPHGAAPTRPRIIAVFGCAGERDKYKRKEMGKIAGKLADISVLTAEDPRSEYVNSIIEEIAAGCTAVGGKFAKIPDRKKAINYAINELAEEGDWVLLLGKGHEQSMCYGEEEREWDERKVVVEVLNSKFEAPNKS